MLWWIGGLVAVIVVIFLVVRSEEKAMRGYL